MPNRAIAAAEYGGDIVEIGRNDCFTIDTSVVAAPVPVIAKYR